MNENFNPHENYPDSQEKIDVPTMKVIPLKKICMTIGELPTSYLETMTYYEMLIWFIEYLRNNIIPTINNNAQAVQEVQAVVLALQNYINDYKDSIDSDVEELEEYMNNYFENLDVQEEINNKLDDMLEDGVLEQIIEQFLQLTSLICFDNVADMKLSPNLANGSYAKTLGYYSKNDGGEALYKVRTITNDDVVDEGSIIALNNNTLIAELIINNNIINIKQFGAKGDNETDDTAAIQKAINYFHVGNDNSNQNYATVLIANYPNAGGTIYFPKGTYCISSTLKIPCYVDLDLGYSTIKAITGGTFTNNYMISVNSFDVITWTYAYVARIGFIRNGIISGNNIENIKGIFITDPHKIENIEFNTLYNSINYPNIVYVDMIYINSIQIRNPKGTECQIVKTSQGENTFIKNIHFPVRSEEENPTQGIRINGGHNGRIENIINGIIYLYNTEDYTISNWHCENGYFYGENFNNTIIKDSNIYARNNQTPITLHGETANNNNRVSYLENVNFIYYLQIDEFNYDTHDIDISTYYQQLFIKGCYRYLWTKAIKAISATGITLYDGTKNLLNPYDDTEIYARAIIPQNSSVRRDAYIFTNASTNAYVNWNKETGTYYYKMANLADVERLCGKITEEKSVDVSSATNGVRLSIQGNLGKGNILRIYRGVTSNNYTEFVDIPSPKTTNLYDNGYSINGYKWKTVSESEPVITSANSIATVERVYNFTNTLVRCKGNGSPSVGTWITGDIVEKASPTAGGNLGYVCTSGGTYGTWKTYGNISE